MSFERHNWSEKDEIALLFLSDWVELNVDKDAYQTVSFNKWDVVSGLLFTKRGVKASPTACRKRVSDINNRVVKKEESGREVISQLGVDFHQHQDQDQSSSLEERLSSLESKLLSFDNNQTKILSILELALQGLEEKANNKNLRKANV